VLDPTSPLDLTTSHNLRFPSLIMKETLCCCTRNQTKKSWRRLTQTVGILLLATRVQSFVGPKGGPPVKEARVIVNVPETTTPDLVDVVSTTQMEQVSSRRMFLGSVIAATIVMASLPVGVKAMDLPSESIADAASSSLLATATTKAAPSPPAAVDFNAVFQKASKKALGGGKAGATAAVVQVLSLMWLRTSMNYQYRYGGNLATSLQTLWQEGGIPRLYQGLPFALIQGPLTRFGDTAANIGILALLETSPETQALPLFIKTGIGSFTAGVWRIFLMPVDASKTALQVEGKKGLDKLLSLVRDEGPSPLYQVRLFVFKKCSLGPSR
jgi:hypothetical protein